MDETTKQKISKSHTGLKQSEQTKQKIRLSMLAYWDEVRETNIALKAAGFEIKRRSHSPTTIAKIKASAQGREFSPLAKQRLREYQQNKRADAKLKRQIEKEKKGIYND